MSFFYFTIRENVIQDIHLNEPDARIQLRDCLVDEVVLDVAPSQHQAVVDMLSHGYTIEPDSPVMHKL